MINEVFTYMEKQVRIVGTSENPLFCLKDVCDILELRVDKVIERLRDDINGERDDPLSKGVVSKQIITDSKAIKNVNINNYSKVKDASSKEALSKNLLLKQDFVDSKGRQQEMYFVTEEGLYLVIMNSRKSIAKKFKFWVVGVLATIRKDGVYEDKDMEFLRRMGIEDRNMFTSAIKLFGVYCNDVHKINSKRYCLEGLSLYQTFSILVNAIVGLNPKNDRNKLSKKQLEMISRCEEKVASILLMDMVYGEVPDIIFIHVKEALLKRRRKFIERRLLDDVVLVDPFTFPGYHRLLKKIKRKYKNSDRKD